MALLDNIEPQQPRERPLFSHTHAMRIDDDLDRPRFLVAGCPRCDELKAELG